MKNFAVSDEVEGAFEKAIRVHRDLEDALDSLRREMKNFKDKKDIATLIGTEIKVGGAILTFVCPPVGIATTLAGTAMDLITEGVDINETSDCYKKIEGYLETYERKMQALDKVLKKLSQPITVHDSSQELKELEQFRKELAGRIAVLLLKAGICVPAGLLMQLGISTLGTLGKQVAKGVTVVAAVTSIISCIKDIASTHPTVMQISNITTKIAKHRSEFELLHRDAVPKLRAKEKRARKAEEERRRLTKKLEEMRKSQPQKSVPTEHKPRVEIVFLLLICIFLLCCCWNVFIFACTCIVLPTATTLYLVLLSTLKGLFIIIGLVINYLVPPAVIFLSLLLWCPQR